MCSCSDQEKCFTGTKYFVDSKLRVLAGLRCLGGNNEAAMYSGGQQGPGNKEPSRRSIILLYRTASSVIITSIQYDMSPLTSNSLPTMLVIFRNPKDTLVSFYHFSNNNPVLPVQSWEYFYSHFLSGDVPWGSYFDHALAWEKRIDDPNVMIVTYEELKQDLSEGVRQISSFFGFSLTEAQVHQIAEGSTFTAMKESAANSHGTMGNLTVPNHFTPEQSQEMDEAFNKHLAGTRLGAKLNYQLHCQ
uniref:Sulfotransferase n=1 Tax=Seriola lalandi dorsalis TaxID=1841481 RepID=A0A3B4YPD7_SERLL